MDLDRNSRLTPYVVCGWYTPDYAQRAKALIESLDRLGEPHDFEAVAAMSGGWERNTMRKPAQIARAMRQHPGKVVIFMDVDCLALESLAPLAETRGDVAVHLMAGKRSRGYGRLFGRSTVMVFLPTTHALALVATWVRLSADAPRGQVDQHTLTDAIARTPGLVVEHLDPRWCAMDKDRVSNPAIVHAGAARGAVKIPSWLRWVYQSVNAIGRGHDHTRAATGAGAPVI